MIEKVLQYVNEQQMIEEGDCVVAGVSGGADSVCLLFILIELQKKIPIEIEVVHINHLIRKEACEDAAYVQKLCELYQLPFILVEEDVQALAHKLHISTEEAGRNVRYQAFERVLGDRQGKIAVAHNKNDCCETFLFHLFRGSSLKGLGGIRPVRGKVIRPLLCLERSEIETFLEERNISYCIDCTNLEDNYTRNKIRHHIVEPAVRDISSMAVNHIGSACDRIWEAYNLIKELTQQGYARSVRVVKAPPTFEETYIIEEVPFRLLHKTIQGYVIMEVLAHVTKSRKDLQSNHIRQVYELLDKQCGKQIHLPFEVCAQRDYTGIYIYRQQKIQVDTQVQKIELSDVEKTKLIEGEELVLDISAHQAFRVKVIPKHALDIDWKNIPQNKYTKLLDYDRIKDNIVIRTRKAGDYLTINAMNQRKTLKAYFIDNKIPQVQRPHCLLVAEGNHIIWVVGGRISNFYKISQQTKYVLQLSYIETATQ